MWSSGLGLCVWSTQQYRQRWCEQQAVGTCWQSTGRSGLRAQTGWWDPVSGPFCQSKHWKSGFTNEHRWQDPYTHQMTKKGLAFNISSSAYYLFWSIKCLKVVNNSLHIFPEPKVTSSSCWFCSTNSLKPKHLLITVRNEKEKQQILSKLHFCFKTKMTIHPSSKQLIFFNRSSSIQVKPVFIYTAPVHSKSYLMLINFKLQRPNSRPRVSVWPQWRGKTEAETSERIPTLCPDYLRTQKFPPPIKQLFF